MVTFKPISNVPQLLVRDGPQWNSEPLFLWVYNPHRVPAGGVNLETSWDRHLGAYIVCGAPATDLPAFEKLIAGDHAAMQKQLSRNKDKPFALFIWYADPDAAIAAGPSLDRPMIVLQPGMAQVFRRAFALRNQYFDFLGNGDIRLRTGGSGPQGIEIAADSKSNLFNHYGLITGGNFDAPDRAQWLSLQVAGPAFVPMEGPHTGSLCYDVEIEPQRMVTYGGDVRYFTGTDPLVQHRYPVLDFWQVKESLAHKARLNPAAPFDATRTRLALSPTDGGYPTSLVSVLGGRVKLNPTPDAGWTFQPIRAGLPWPLGMQQFLKRFGKAAPELFYLSPVGDWTIERDAAFDAPVRVLCGVNGTEFLHARPGDLLRFEANKPASAARAVGDTGTKAPASALVENGCRTSWATMVPGDTENASSGDGAFVFGYFAQPLTSVAYGSMGAGNLDSSRGDLALLGAYGVQLSALGEDSNAFPLAPVGGINQKGDVSGLGFADRGKPSKFAKLPLNQPDAELHFADFERTVISPARQAAVTPNADTQGKPVGPRFVADAAPPLTAPPAPQALLGAAAGAAPLALGAAPGEGQQGLTPQGLVGAYIAGSLAWQRLIFARDMSKGTAAPPAQRQDLAFENGLNPRLGEALMHDSLFLVISNTANIGLTASEAGDTTNGSVEINFQNSFLVPGSRQAGRAPEDIFKITVDLAAPGAERRSILIAKYVTGVSVKDLVDDVGRWTLPGDFNDEGKDKGTYPVQAFLQKVITNAITAVKAGGSGDSGNSAARWLSDFARTVQEENWTGILAIDCPVPGGGLPEELQALRGGMSQPLKAHHMGVSANQVTFSKADGGASVSIDVAESAIFGLVQYPPFGAPAPTFTDLEAPQDYLVRELDILFANSAIADFFCEIHLLINRLFGRDVKLSEPATRASGETLPPNVIPIFGYYADHDGEKRFSFVAPGASIYTMKQPENEPVRRVLEAVGIESAVFRVTDQTQEGSGSAQVTRIRARFGLAGGLSFNVLGGDMDLFGYAGDSALPVAGMNIDVKFALHPDGTLSDRAIAFSLDQARVDKNRIADPRPGSIQGNMPLALHAFRTNTEKPEEGLNAGALNSKAVLSNALADEITAAPRYVLQYALPLGDFGKLASTKIAFTANVYLGWGPQETSPGNDGVGLFLDLPLPVPGIAGFNLQGVLHTNFGTINLDRVMRTPNKGGKQQPLYVLTFSNVTIGFLVFKLPPGQIVNFYIFGDPESDSPADSNIAWLLAVKDKEKDTGTDTKQIEGG
jgi:hypothetical protein